MIFFSLAEQSGWQEGVLDSAADDAGLVVVDEEQVVAAADVQLAVADEESGVPADAQSAAVGEELLAAVELGQLADGAAELRLSVEDAVCDSELAAE